MIDNPLGVEVFPESQFHRQAVTCSTFECLTALALSPVPFPDACMHSVIQSIPRSEEALDEQQRGGEREEVEGTD